MVVVNLGQAFHGFGAVNTKTAVLEGLAHHRAGRLPEAEAAYRRVLDADPDQPDALNLLGAVAQHFGRYDEAVGLIERALSVGPPAAETHTNFANALMAQGRFDAAIDAYTRSIELKPHVAATHNALGAAFMARGHTDRAAESFDRATALDPTDMEAHGNLGAACLALGRFDDAAGAFRRVIELKPNHAEAHKHLGVSLIRSNRTDDAMAAFQRAVDCRADYGGAHANLGMCLLDKSRFEEAGAAFRRALQCDPAIAEAHIGLALGAIADHQYQTAIDACGRALEINPSSVEAHTNRGVALEYLGRLAEAEAAYRRALEIDPAFGEAHRNLGSLTTYHAGDPAIAAMGRALEDPTISDSNRIHLQSALAKAYEDVGDHDKAFICLATGNRLRRRTLRYAMTDRDTEVERIVKTYTPALFSRLDGAGCLSALPVFIVGMPRSGSSLVEQILASHPLIHGAGERRHMAPIAATLADRVADADPDRLKQLGDRYVDDISHHGEARVIDKAPGNYQRLGLIRLILPRARIIHCHRDPVDTCLSCFNPHFPSIVDIQCGEKAILL